jgi:hypothetical protein
MNLSSNKKLFVKDNEVTNVKDAEMLRRQDTK